MSPSSIGALGYDLFTDRGATWTVEADGRKSPIGAGQVSELRDAILSAESIVSPGGDAEPGAYKVVISRNTSDFCVFRVDPATECIQFGSPNLPPTCRLSVTSGFDEVMQALRGAAER